MKLRAIALALAISLAAGAASAASIGVYFDTAGTDCDYSVGMYQPVNFYVLAQLGGASADGVTGAEFRILNWPGSWFANITANPAANTVLGNLWTGTNIAFSACQPGASGVVLLYSVGGLATSLVGETYLTVAQHFTPSNPSFPCPLVTLCDAPVYTKSCVSGGVAILNGRSCQIGVESTSWSHVKGLYN
jgi:hypothetical protein